MFHVEQGITWLRTNTAHARTAPPAGKLGENGKVSSSNFHSALSRTIVACSTAPCSNWVMITVRDESPGDRKAVYQVVSSAFGQSVEAELVEALREDGDSVVSLVAAEDGQIVGHVLLSRMDAPFPALALAPVSVIPARQQSGIGSTLIKSAVNRVRSEGWVAIFVLGDPNYYERFGFDREAAAGFRRHMPGAISWRSNCRRRSPLQLVSYATRRRSLPSIRHIRRQSQKTQTETLPPSRFR